MIRYVDAGPYRQLIRRQDLPLRAVAARAGISESEVGCVACGKKTRIPVAIAAALAVNLDGTIVLPGSGGGAL